MDSPTGSSARTGSRAAPRDSSGRGGGHRGRALAASAGAGVAVAAALALGGCTSGQSAATSTAQKVSANTIIHRKMVIETGHMDGKPGWPRFTPAGFTAPAGATIVLTIVNYDDGAAPLPPASPWGQVWGPDATFGEVTGGTELVNGTKVNEISNQLVSHTFEIPALLVNIPIPAASSSSHPVTVTYTFKVNKSGTFLWICAAPCGSGSAGMGGAMNTNGWMRGYVHIT
ncbi:MAG: hypothetical protein M0Z92_09470 [Actinomycetota bacterium]|nr:hypothetical protein [Actinomycetota bacterium]